MPSLRDQLRIEPAPTPTTAPVPVDPSSVPVVYEFRSSGSAGTVLLGVKYGELRTSTKARIKSTGEYSQYDFDILEMKQLPHGAGSWSTWTPTEAQKSWILQTIFNKTNQSTSPQTYFTKLIAERIGDLSARLIEDNYSEIHYPSKREGAIARKSDGQEMSRLWQALNFFMVNGHINTAWTPRRAVAERRVSDSIIRSFTINVLNAIKGHRGSFYETVAQEANSILSVVGGPGRD